MYILIKWYLFIILKQIFFIIYQFIHINKYFLLIFQYSIPFQICLSIICNYLPKKFAVIWSWKIKNNNNNVLIFGYKYLIYFLYGSRIKYK